MKVFGITRARGQKQRQELKAWVIMASGSMMEVSKYIVVGRSKPDCQKLPSSGFRMQPPGVQAASSND